MEKKEKNRSYIRYIDGLKGIACTLIMCGHYYGIYKYASNKDALDLSIFSVFEHPPFAFLMNESYWLSLFFVISGYLISIQPIMNIFDLGKKCVRRALRFLLPIYGACFFIESLYLLIGFHNGELQRLIANEWLESFYQDKISIKTILVEPFQVVFLVKETPSLNSPWWCIGGMFYTSLLIYILNFIREKKQKLALALLIVIMCFLWIKRENQFIGIFVSGLLGMAVYWFEEIINRVLSKRYIYILGAMGLVFVSAFQVRTDLKPLYFAILIGIIPQLHHVKEILASRFLVFLGTISFGIYSFHWPIFCSIGMLILKKEINEISMGISFLITYIVSMGGSICLAYIYHIVIERPIAKTLIHR